MAATVQPPASERALGMEYYLTDGPGLGGRLRVNIEDFRVEEIPAPLPERPDGQWTAVWLRARNWETHRLGMVLGDILHIGKDQVRFAGTKDKRAVTVQQITVPVPPESVARIRLDDIEVVWAKRVARAVRMGELLGNRFEIVVRGIGMGPEEARSVIESDWARLSASGGFPNYFGVQRFGTMRANTHHIGRRIVKGDWEGAVLEYCASPGPDDPPGDRLARETLTRDRDFRWAAANYPEYLGFERAMCRYLADYPGDWVGAIKSVPKRLSLMFVHAYQSYMFNLTISERIRRGLPLNDCVEGDLVVPLDADGVSEQDRPVPVEASNIERVRAQLARGRCRITAPLFGSRTVLAGGVPGECERSVLAKEGVQARDFIVTQMPHTTTDGSRRAIVAPVEGFSFDTSADDGGCAATFKFTLKPGCYATTLLREFMKSDVTSY